MQLTRTDNELKEEHLLNFVVNNLKEEHPIDLGGNVETTTEQLYEVLAVAYLTERRWNDLTGVSA